MSLLLFATQVLDVSSCDRVSHVGLSSILNSAPGLRQLRLAYHSFVSKLFIYFFPMTSKKCKV